MNTRNNRVHANANARDVSVFAGDERAVTETFGYVLLIVITVTAFAVLLAFAPGALTDQQHSITHENTVSEFNNLHDTVTRTVHSPATGSNTVRIGTQGGIIHTPGDAPTSEQTITVRALDDNGDVIHEHETRTNPLTFENPDGTIHYEHGAVTWVKNTGNTETVEGMSREPEWVFNTTEHAHSDEHDTVNTSDAVHSVFTMVNHSRTNTTTGERVITGSERGGAEVTITNTDTPFNTANTGTSVNEHERNSEHVVENVEEIEVEIETLAPNAWETYLNQHNPTTTTTSETVGDEHTNTVTGVFPANTVTIDEHDIELAPA